MQNFKELRVWQRTRVLVKQVYLLTTECPNSEKYNLSSQMEYSAVSGMSSIAVGSGRGSDIDFSRFLNMSLGSAHRTESQQIVLCDLGNSSEDTLGQFTSELSEIVRMIVPLIKKLRNN
ncbi:four helix bundle protein [Roseivirga sp. UBA1976]|uniref:four helix bundle protein n=1 Tax=Roseivirga sp. UBA1976 TaxID=1947386 RepID=UPI00257B7CE0|nr:four helix bundle protein [Roseivirga sp. UBA1976]|tara:strand:- start:8313 stop:8669 length:357 start_codon:yes stop_codon:yes gene_type:complete